MVDRLVRLAHGIGVERALGVDEDTALVCSGQWQCRVAGSAGVWLLDMSQLNNGGQHCHLYGDNYCTFNNVITSYVTKDDLISLDSWTVEFADWKQRVIEDDNLAASESEDIFGTETKGEFGRVANSLLLSEDVVTRARTLEQTPVQYEIVFRKQSEILDGVETVAVQDEDGVISYRDLALDFVPIDILLGQTANNTR